MKKNLLLIFGLLILSGCVATNQPSTGTDGSGARLGGSDKPVKVPDVYLIPMYGFPMERANRLEKDIKKELGLSVTVSTHMGYSDSMVNEKQKQYDAGKIAWAARGVIRRLPGDLDNTTFLVLLDRDLNSRPFNLRYNFSAHFDRFGKITPISTTRMDPVTFNQRPDEELLYSRLKKMAYKSIGIQHYGYDPSSDLDSVMYGPIMSLDDLDRMGSRFKNEQAQPSKEQSFSPAPDGYSWQPLAEIDAAFLKPDGWFFKHQQNGYNHFYAISKESIEEKGSFDTGITVQLVNHVAKNSGYPPSTAAVNLAQAISEKESNKVLLTANSSAGPFKSYVLRFRSAPVVAPPVVIHQMYVSNDRDDMLFIITVESPESSWNETWTIVEPILSSFLIEGYQHGSEKVTVPEQEPKSEGGQGN
ncbi:MAG: hypothetical protein WC334_02020 [Kiritimatiellales bacterium]|jgi:predicted Zn-dependent protease